MGYAAAANHALLETYDVDDVPLGVRYVGDVQVGLLSHAAPAAEGHCVPRRVPGVYYMVRKQPDFEMQPARQEDWQEHEVFPALLALQQQVASHVLQAHPHQGPARFPEMAGMGAAFDAHQLVR